ncbi:MAG: ATP synthase F1 subunit epsilon [Prevotellaceae bacterium]|jgi:F-type H+-transporting ATPase subunit epsilon|nr:ATP synthase F1 subunit epsilon [Prevotellaceae bacterium]
MVEKIYIHVVSPKETVYEGELLYAVFPGYSGEFAVYPAHAPIISALTAGVIKCVIAEGTEKTLPINGGFAEVNNNRITVCVE